MGVRRTVAAFLIAPLGAPFAFAILLPLARETGANLPSAGYFEWILLYSIYAVPIAYFAELVLGIPAWMLFKRFHVHSLPVFAIAGALMGLLVYLGITLGGAAAFGPLDTVPSPVMPWSNPYLFVCVVAGASSATVFWAITFAGIRVVGDSNQPQRNRR
jgi:hypothetical protein